MTLRERFEKEGEDLRAIRGELKVRMHLARLDAADLWEDLEDRWQHADAKLEAMSHASAETAEDVGAALKRVFEELERGYERLRSLI
jgi:hypothetical protein